MAVPGDHDPSFDGNGRRVIGFGGTDAANALLVPPNGRIVVVGGGGAAPSFCLVRLRANGQLDATFGPKRRIRLGGTNDAA